MVSGNDAAVALAEFVGGSVEGFANIMNQKASDLGLTSTHFVTPHGLDNDAHYTTAYELAKLADYALQNKTFAKIVRTSNYTVNISGRQKALKNTNELLGYFDGVYGVKTGFTNGANRCLVSSCKRGNLDVISVVLGCDTKKDRTLDSINLLNYIFNNFSIINIKDIINKNFEVWKNEHSKSFYVEKGVTSNIEVYLNENQIPYESILINNASLDKVSTPISFLANYKAPLYENTVVGNMDVLLDAKSLFSIDVLCKNRVERKNSWFYFNYFLKNYFTYFYDN